MAEKKTNSFFKRLVGFLHFLFACVTLVGIGFMYLNSNYGRGLDWIKTETFEQSPDFSKKVQADITNIFDYVQYQDIFESNGEVDYSQVVLEVTTGSGRYYPVRKIPGLLHGRVRQLRVKGRSGDALRGRSGTGLCPLPLLPV